MKDSVWKRISAKRPKGKNLIKMIGIGSGAIWILAIAAAFLVKTHSAKVEALGRGGAKAASTADMLAAVTADENATDGKAAEDDSDDDEAEEGVALAKAGSESSPGAEGSVAGSEQAADGKTETKAAGKAGAAYAKSVNAEGSETADEGGEASASDAEGGKKTARAAEGSSLPSKEELAALRQLAELYVASGDPAKAVTPMRRVMMMPTREVKLLRMATDVFLGTGNYSEAGVTSDQVLALEPDNMDVKVQAVEARYRLGKVDKAMADAQAALKAHAGNLAMLVELGTMEVEMGSSSRDYGKSLAAALKLKPDYAPAVYLSGRKAQLEGDYHDAEIAFRKAVKLDPRNAKAHGQLGMALYHQGKENDAEKEYRAELDMNPEDYNTWFNLGEIQLARADREVRPAEIPALRAEAMESYLKALELNPDHAEAHYRVGVLLNGNGEYKEAIRHLEAALKLDDRHVPTLVQLSLAYENLKQPERARAYLTKAYELDPLNKVVLFKLRQWS